MIYFLGMLRWMRAAQTLACVRFCEHRLAGARVDLARALAAHDAAMAEVLISETPSTEPASVPDFLLKKEAA
jgi:hypothetical protein